MIMECIKEGFALANKNVHLVFIRVAVSLINLLGIVVFLGLPVIASLMYLGFDLARAQDIIPSLIGNPFEFITKYMSVFFLIATSFLFYLAFSAMVFFYSLGGTLGVLKNSVVNIQYTFRFSSFFKEAGSNFSRLMGLASLVVISLTALGIAFVITGAAIAAFTGALTETGSTLEMFFSSFSFMTIVVLSIILVLYSLVFAVFSSLGLVVDGKGVMESIGRTFRFLNRTPHAYVYYLVLVAGFIVVNAVLYGLQVPVSLIPFFTPLLYVFNAFIQSYLAIVLWSSLIVYYVKATNYPVYSSTYEI
jgi:hypothetical protein